MLYVFFLLFFLLNVSLCDDGSFPGELVDTLARGACCGKIRKRQSRNESKPCWPLDGVVGLHLKVTWAQTWLPSSGRHSVAGRVRLCGEGEALQGPHETVALRSSSSLGRLESAFLGLFVVHRLNDVLTSPQAFLAQVV